MRYAVLDQRVLEPVFGLGPAARLADQVEPHQRREGRPHVAVTAHGVEQRAVRTRVRGRTRPSGRRAAGVEPVDPREDHLLDGRRDLDRGIVVVAPRVVLAHERARVGQRSDQLLQEERAAFARGRSAVPCRRERPGADQRVEQVEPCVAGERLEGKLGRPVRELPAGPPSRATRVVPLLPEREDQEQRGVLGVGKHPLDQPATLGPTSGGPRARPRPGRPARGAAASAGPPRTSGTGGPRARAPRDASWASGSSVSPSIAARYG